MNELNQCCEKQPKQETFLDAMLKESRLHNEKLIELIIRLRKLRITLEQPNCSDGAKICEEKEPFTLPEKISKEHVFRENIINEMQSIITIIEKYI